MAGAMFACANGGIARSKITPKPSASTSQPMMSSVSGQVCWPLISTAGNAGFAGPEHAGGGAVAEQRGGDDVFLGELVEPEREGAELDRDDQHQAARPGLGKSGPDRDARRRPRRSRGRRPGRARHRAESRCARRRGLPGWAWRCLSMKPSRRYRRRPPRTPAASRAFFAASKKSWLAPSRYAALRSGQPSGSRYQSRGRTVKRCRIPEFSNTRASRSKSSYREANPWCAAAAASRCVTTWGGTAVAVESSFTDGVIRKLSSGPISAGCRAGRDAGRTVIDAWPTVSFPVVGRGRMCINSAGAGCSGRPCSDIPQ